MQSGANLSSKDLNYTKYKFEDKIEFFIKSLLKSTLMYKRMNSKIIIVKPLSFLVYTITIIIKGVVAKLDA